MLEKKNKQTIVIYAVYTEEYTFWVLYKPPFLPKWHWESFIKLDMNKWKHLQEILDKKFLWKSSYMGKKKVHKLLSYLTLTSIDQLQNV